MIEYIPLKPVVIAAHHTRKLQTTEQPTPKKNYARQQLRKSCEDALHSTCQRTQETRYPQSIQTDILDLAFKGERAVVIFREKHQVDTKA